MDKPFGWAVIGCGAIANTVMKEITKTQRHRVISVYSRTKEKSAKFANKYNAVSCDTMLDAIKHEGVEGVYLATPHSCHYSEIMECIGEGVPVLSEKAFTINASETCEIINRERSSYVSEAMWTRYNPITQAVKRYIDDGALGKITSVYMEFSYPYALSNFSKRVVMPEYGGGALLDIGVYPVSYAEMLFGMPSNIEATAKFNRFGTDKHDNIRLTYDNGVVCNIVAGLDKFSLCPLRIVGERGSISMPLFYRPTRAHFNVDGRKFTLKTKAGYIHEFDAVARDIRNGLLESSQISLLSSHNVMLILDTIRGTIGLSYSEAIESTKF